TAGPVHKHRCDNRRETATDHARYLEAERLLLATSPGPFRRFNLAHPKSLILQEGVLAFFLPY
ncbi:MAG TPA: hypothetical protein VH369_05365, partial [Bryobacteraceae bacterium]